MVVPLAERLYNRALQFYSCCVLPGHIFILTTFGNGITQFPPESALVSIALGNVPLQVVNIYNHAILYGGVFRGK